MADFLNRLAARALGATPLAEPVIPTRFSSGREQSAFLASEPDFQTARPEASSDIFEERPRSQRSRETDLSFETNVDHPSPFEGLDEAPHPPRSPRPRGFPSQAPPSFAERETVQPSPDRFEVRRQHIAAATDPSSVAVERPAAATPRTSAPFAEPQPAPRLNPLAESMRGPALQHPELRQTFRPAPPTVHVSIGRIEVRAEIASPVSAAPAKRPRPSTLSLDQFLKQGSGGAQ
jgi:hypothetical protein